MGDLFHSCVAAMYTRPESRMDISVGQNKIIPLGERLHRTHAGKVAGRVHVAVLLP